MKNHWNELLTLLDYQSGDKIIDIGGGHDPVPIADVVVDMVNLGNGGKSYILLDITSELLPFQDNEFDIAICSQTLEDLSCPTLILKEISRVAKRGIIEVPHRGPESIQQFHARNKDYRWYDSDPMDELYDKIWTFGGGHHKWLIEEINNELHFTPKLYHWLMRYPIPRWTGPGGIRYIWHNKIEFKINYDIFNNEIAQNYKDFRENNKRFWK